MAVIDGSAIEGRRSLNGSGGAKNSDETSIADMRSPDPCAKLEELYGSRSADSGSGDIDGLALGGLELDCLMPTPDSCKSILCAVGDSDFDLIFLKLGEWSSCVAGISSKLCRKRE
jgi:hypothetical protein